MMNLLTMKRNKRDRHELTEIILKMDRVMNVDDRFDKYCERAEDLKESLQSFYRIRKKHRKIHFPYDDVLNKELRRYNQDCVPNFCNLTGEVLLTPFDMLEKACSVVVKKDGTKLNYLNNLRIGNRTIGQAWLSDGTEVFNPRDAIARSIQDTSRMLRTWAISFQERLS